ncbi:MAG: tetratricopeptide repeat protein [Gemmatimonadaceae bacterium]
MTRTGAAARPSLDLEPESLADTVQFYQKQIIIGAIVIAVAVAGVWMYRRSADIKETRAAEAYAAAETAFGAGNVALAQPELERVLSRYAGTTAGTQSAMLLAQLLFDQGKPAEGLAQLQRALDKSPEALKPGLLNLIGSGHEAAGESKEAADAFQRAAAATKFATEKDQLRMSAARNLMAAGNVAGARAIYEEIAGREDSDYAGEARVRLGETIVKS